MELKVSKTLQHLKDACAGESKTNRRNLYFVATDDVTGVNDVPAVLRSTAEGETGHAHGRPSRVHGRSKRSSDRTTDRLDS